MNKKVVIGFICTLIVCFGFYCFFRNPYIVKEKSKEEYSIEYVRYVKKALQTFAISNMPESVTLQQLVDEDYISEEVGHEITLKTPLDELFIVPKELNDDSFSDIELTFEYDGETHICGLKSCN